MTKPHSLRQVPSFGKVAAEDDSVLDYFLSTDAVTKISSGEVVLVLGRKGSGKTALVRYLTERKDEVLSRSLNLRNYPWRVHAARMDNGATEVEAYVSSWRYLLAAEIAALVSTRASARQNKAVKAIAEFFRQNYGGPDPELDQILRPPSLTFTKGAIEPTVLGNKLFSVSLERSKTDQNLGLELNAISSALLDAAKQIALDCQIGPVSLHFDELDQGLTTADPARMKMIVGLILAARDVRRAFAKGGALQVFPVVYLRTDIWDDLEFSDKNKIERDSCLALEWSASSLVKLINTRLKRHLGEDAEWASVEDGEIMRGSQTKWNHIVARTFMRPRDIIQFCNSALSQAKTRNDEPLVFANRDIVGARDKYSKYLKKELDDEILPHWPRWTEALQACSALQTITFSKAAFIDEYEGRRSAENTVSGADALRRLYGFSVVGYERRSGYGGSSWAFHYLQPEAGWDPNAVQFKVHLGLKEHAKLREERVR